MNNLLRALIYHQQVSLTLADTTEIVKEGGRLHGLSPAATYVFGRGMSALTFLSACLKEEQGEISIALQCDGELGSIGASGNRALALRGYIENTQLGGEPTLRTEKLVLGKNGSFTVVRDDGYTRPFVGSCAFPENADFDSVLEEYFRISEQLPTRIATVVEVDEGGRCAFSGVLALQPLPFADKQTIEKVNELDLYAIVREMKLLTLDEVAKKHFAVENAEYRKAEYRCNCSRQRLASVLITLGEAQLRDVIKTEGSVRVHCHYCNTDYLFTDEDIDKLFLKEE